MKQLSLTFLITCIFWMLLIQGLHADTVHPELEACRKLINGGGFEEAREKVKQFRRKHPDNPRGLFLLARLEEDNNKALALYREVEILAVHPDFPNPDSAFAAEAVFARAEILFSGGDLSKAGDLYERLITAYPGSGFFCDAVYRLGTINLARGEPRKALEKFRTCLEIDSTGTKRALAAAGKMECYVELKDWQEALTAARETLDEKDEESAMTPRVLEVIALAWREIGDEDNAARFTERLLRNYPDSYQAHVIRENGNRIANIRGLSFDSRDASADSVKEESPVLYTDKEKNSIQSENSVTEKQPDESATSAFSVQAAAFEKRMFALRMYNKLKEAGFDVRIEMKTVGNKHYYPVLIGRFRTRKEADRMVDRVAAATGDKAFVIILK